MKKNTLLDTKGFLLMETLLVSLTIAGILLYMYVQYSRITDSYYRLSSYNSVEKLYRTGNLKNFLIIEDEDDFYKKVDDGNTAIWPRVKGVYVLGANNFSNSQILSRLGLESAYIVKGDADLTKVDASFGPFLKTIPKVNESSYQLIVKYKYVSDDGDDVEFAAITLKED